MVLVHLILDRRSSEILGCHLIRRRILSLRTLCHKPEALPRHIRFYRKKFYLDSTYIARMAANDHEDDIMNVVGNPIVSTAGVDLVELSTKDIVNNIVSSAAIAGIPGAGSTPTYTRPTARFAGFAPGGFGGFPRFVVALSVAFPLQNTAFAA
ncbi:uncharacterized protein LOC127248009 [Andrographis paniculata]|uniref:uncharacterized protein LOC127248009 n=1 Tax=Andrographis paniculata TaxID=175694 RepID=UPI0021E81598|nr:uncharacterized protein LOC127248009 [Andrographis paniculata]